jgi:hypothetical protein
MRNSLRLLATGVLAALMAAGAQATPRIVTTTADSGAGSLRQAIIDANTADTADTITFSVSGTITLASALPTIIDTGVLVIDGTGQAVTISGNSLHRVLEVSSASTVSLIRLTIVGGNATTLSPPFGGGILNYGDLNVTETTLAGNVALDGGALFNAGNTIIHRSTFSGNTAVVGGGAAAVGGNGGAIANVNSLVILNSTFSANTATGQPGPTGGAGGAIFNLPGTQPTTTAVAMIESSTFYGNSASGGLATGGAIANYGKQGETFVQFFNTIVAGSPSGGNCGGAAMAFIFDDGNNIDDGATCGWTGVKGSMSNTSPLLGPLAANGGPTQTMALLPGSPAIDGVTYNAPNGVPAIDQRGVLRPQGGRYDIGAYELVVPPASVPTLNEWMLTALIGLLVLAGTVAAGRQRR